MATRYSAFVIKPLNVLQLKNNPAENGNKNKKGEKTNKVLKQTQNKNIKQERTTATAV